MRKYLSTIHTKSESHKKRFAFLVSGGFTLSIFAIWSFVNFSPSMNDSSVVATGEYIDESSESEESNSPFNNIGSGVAASVQALKEQFNNAKGTVKSVNLESEYEQMRKDALNESNTVTNTYGN